MVELPLNMEVASSFLGPLESFSDLLPTKSLIESKLKDCLDGDLYFMIMRGYNLFQENNYEQSEKIMDIVLDVTWEDLNTGHWSEVPFYRRLVFSIVSLIKVVSRVEKIMSSEKKLYVKQDLEDALKAVDRGILLGGDLSDHQLTIAAQRLSEALSKFGSGEETVGVFEVGKDQEQMKFPGIQCYSLPEMVCPSLETFQRRYFMRKNPAKLKGCINHWPALDKWKNISYLLDVAGNRTVPVEIGSRYDHAEWSQKLIKFKDFLAEHVLNEKCGEKSTATGYLAQHQLFDQIPELKADIRVPEYCCCSDKLKDWNPEEEVDINAWFGPAGTVSPLHFDPKHNLLTQVVGRKRVILVDPKYSAGLKPYEGNLLGNTAQFDPENPDIERFPDYDDIIAVETILNPGEMLYIPPKWWHHVRSLDVSFSVSFWW